MELSGRPRKRDERERFWQLRASGMSARGIAAALGVSPSSAAQWARESGGVRPRAASVPSGRYLSLDEREEIMVLKAEGRSKAQIAVALGRHPATIGRELARNSQPLQSGRATRDYRSGPAQRRAAARARRPKACKLDVRVNPELHDHVQAKLTRKWSPEQISKRLPEVFPDRPEMRVSHETIYQALYVQSRGALRRELTACLRTGRAVRRAKANPSARRSRIVPDELLIAERPAEVEDRAVPGHWEGDLITGENNGSAIGTLVERTTRFTILLPLPGTHTAEDVRDALIPAIQSLPLMLRRSLTWDQGVEMARHAEITLATDIAIWFCDPRSPWQRGTNENTNGLLRQYFPKGTDLSKHTAEHLAEVANELNDRPRKTLGWKTPHEALTELLATTA